MYARTHTHTHTHTAALLSHVHAHMHTRNRRITRVSSRNFCLGGSGCDDSHVLFIIILFLTSTERVDNNYHTYPLSLSHVYLHPLNVTSTDSSICPRFSTRMICTLPASSLTIMGLISDTYSIENAACN